LAVERRASRSGPAAEWLERGTKHDHWNQECPPWSSITTEEVAVNVIIGIDPHKASHTAVAIDRAEDELARVRVRATRRQVTG
jgi:hypothetical protein